MQFRKFVAALALVALLAACSSGNAPTGSEINSNSVVQQQTPVPVDPANAGLVARVNGVGISVEMYNSALQRRLNSTAAADRQALERQVLDTLIEQQLINQAAPSLGINITDQDVVNEIANLRSLVNTDEAWQQYLTINGYSEDEMIDAQHDLLITQAVRDMLMMPYLVENVEQVNARHIVVRTRELADEALDRLSAGEGFATLAAEYSIDTTTRDSGGNLGWFTRDELFYPNLADIAFDLEPGQIAGPVATSLGYHIIQTMDRQVRPIEPGRIPMLSESIFNNWLDEVYRAANIERYLNW